MQLWERAKILKGLGELCERGRCSYPDWDEILIYVTGALNGSSVAGCFRPYNLCLALLDKGREGEKTEEARRSNMIKVIQHYSWDWNLSLLG